MMRRLLILNSVLLAILIVLTVVMLIKIGRTESKLQRSGERSLRPLIYTQSGRDLLVENVEALISQYDFASLPPGRSHMDDFRNGRGFAYEDFAPYFEQSLNGDLYVFETEFGTSFATAYDIDALAAMVDARRQMAEIPTEDESLFPEGSDDPFSDLESSPDADSNGESDAYKGGARQPATAPDSKSEGNEKPKPESEGRSQ